MGSVEIKLGVSGSWEYSWVNRTGEERPIELTADYVAHGDDGYFFSLDESVDRVDLPSNPADTGSNPNHAMRTFAHAVDAGPFWAGFYTATVTVASMFWPVERSAATQSQSVNFEVRVAQVPEPETYAMMLGGLALLGWRLRRSASRSKSARKCSWGNP